MNFSNVDYWHNVPSQAWLHFPQSFFSIGTADQTVLKDMGIVALFNVIYIPYKSVYNWEVDAILDPTKTFTVNC